MEQDVIVADINEAVHLLETYQLSSLVWRFNECPLAELKHYVPKGKEELVVIANKDDKFIPNRLVFEPRDNGDISDSIITLKFHDEWYIFIILGVGAMDKGIDVS
jgi:hypothetical protein